MSERTPLVGLYPGTFDPVTLGHVEIIRRACRLVDRLGIAIAVNAGKRPALPIAERIRLTESDIAPLVADGAAIEVIRFDELLIHLARRLGARVVIRGLRAVSDFDFEFQMAGLNAQMAPEIETIFLMASAEHQFISSSFVRDIARHGGEASQFCSPEVARALAARIGETRKEDDRKEGGGTA